IPARRRAGAFWSVLTVLAAVAMLVAAFLPWARLEIFIDLLGASVTNDLGAVAGIEADGTVVVVPVLALAAIVVALWGAVGRDARIASLAALPGGLVLVDCLVFALRLRRAGDRFGSEGALGSSHTSVSLDYGWYLCAAASLLVVGLSLARPFAGPLVRRARARTGGPDHAAGLKPDPAAGPGPGAGPGGSAGQGPAGGPDQIAGPDRAGGRDQS
ncbi:hypothetical protein AB0J52_39375, partial [Spirillospora sp. NPDC049652]